MNQNNPPIRQNPSSTSSSQLPSEKQVWKRNNPAITGLGSRIVHSDLSPSVSQKYRAHGQTGTGAHSVEQ